MLASLPKLAAWAFVVAAGLLFADSFFHFLPDGMIQTVMQVVAVAAGAYLALKQLSLVPAAIA